MGSRADFYLGRGAKAKWIGSVTYGGYPPCENGRTPIINVCESKSEKQFIQNVKDIIAIKTNIGYNTESGWPWEYDNSRKTDYSYFFSYNLVKCSCYGSVLFNPFKNLQWEKEKYLNLPDMSALRKPK